MKKGPYVAPPNLGLTILKCLQWLLLVVPLNSKMCQVDTHWELLLRISRLMQFFRLVTVYHINPMLFSIVGGIKPFPLFE